MKDLVKIGNSFNIPLKTYIADFEEDLDVILTKEKPPVGSIVEVINTGIYKKYKLGNDLKWYEILLNNNEGSIQPGITPNISINATVNNAVGTPSVSIEKTGTLENPVFNLSFENLKGADGKTPEKGIDYYTETDKKEIIDDVIASLPVYGGEVIPVYGGETENV